MPPSCLFDPFRLGARVDRAELMDSVPISADTMRETLAFLALTNRRFGGAALVLRHLSAWAKKRSANETLTVLDVGTGAGDIPLAIARWARRRGRRVRVTAIDIVPEIVDIARANAGTDPDVCVRAESAEDLAARGERFDYVIGSLFLHHVPPARSAEVLRLFDRLATRGVLLSDLYRSNASLIAVGAAALAFGNAIVRHDAPLSVRRAFRPRELDALAREAGLSYLSARREPWFRVSLAGEK